MTYGLRLTQYDNEIFLYFEDNSARDMFLSTLKLARSAPWLATWREDGQGNIADFQEFEL